MALLIDSSVFVALEREAGPGGQLPPELLDADSSLAAITASELLHGVHRADSAVRRGRRESIVEDVLKSFAVLPFDLDVAREHSRLWADLSSRGTMIGAHDLQIAATARRHGLALLTRNLRDFDRVPDLEVRRW